MLCYLINNGILAQIDFRTSEATLYVLEQTLTLYE